MNQLMLERDLTVWAGNVSGVVADREKRTELYAVVRRAVEAGKVDPDDIASHLLFPNRIAERLLHICETLGLLQAQEGRYTITEEGERVAGTEQVFVPQRGTWTIWASDDPLLQAPVLYVERFDEPSAFDEVRGELKDRRRQMDDTPRWLREFTAQPFEPAVSARPTRIDHLERKAEPTNPDASLRLIWNVGQGELRVVGGLGERDVDAEIGAPDKPPAELVRNLLECAGLWNDWDDERQELLVFFDDTSDVERLSMTRYVPIKPRIPGFGEFDPLTLPLKINAATPDDAQRWADWRLANGVDDYATTVRYDEWAQEAAGPFEPYDVQLPTRSELARDYATKGDVPNWHLVAAEDWRL